MVYFAYFQSIVEYACEIYGHKSIGSIAKIDAIQNKAMKIVYGKHTNVDRALLANRIPRFKDIVRTRTCLFMFDAFKHQLPPGIQSLFILNRDVAIRHSKFSLYFKTQASNCQTFSTSLLSVGIKHWNSLPCEIKQIGSRHLFKKLV